MQHTSLHKPSAFNTLRARIPFLKPGTSDGTSQKTEPVLTAPDSTPANAPAYPPLAFDPVRNSVMPATKTQPDPAEPLLSEASFQDAYQTISELPATSQNRENPTDFQPFESYMANGEYKPADDHAASWPTATWPSTTNDYMPYTPYDNSGYGNFSGYSGYGYDDMYLGHYRQPTPSEGVAINIVKHVLDKQIEDDKMPAHLRDKIPPEKRKEMTEYAKLLVPTIIMQKQVMPRDFEYIMQAAFKNNFDGAVDGAVRMAKAGVGLALAGRFAAFMMNAKGLPLPGFLKAIIDVPILNMAINGIGLGVFSGSLFTPSKPNSLTASGLMQSPGYTPGLDYGFNHYQPDYSNFTSYNPPNTMVPNYSATPYTGSPMANALMPPYAGARPDPSEAVTEKTVKATKSKPAKDPDQVKRDQIWQTLFIVASSVALGYAIGYMQGENYLKSTQPNPGPIPNSPANPVWPPTPATPYPENGNGFQFNPEDFQNYLNSLHQNSVLGSPAYRTTDPLFSQYN